MSNSLSNEQLLERFEQATTFSEQKQILFDLVASNDPGALFQVRNLLLDIRDLNLLRLASASSLRKWGEETFFDLDFGTLTFTQKLNFLRIGCLSQRRDEIILLGLDDEDQGVQYETARMIERLPEPPGRKVLNMMRTLALNSPEKKVLVALVKALAAHPSMANIEILNRISLEYSNLPEVVQAVVRAEKQVMDYSKVGARFCRTFPFMKGLHDLVYGVLDYFLKPREAHFSNRPNFIILFLVLSCLLISGLAVFGINQIQTRETEWVAGSHHCPICGLIQTPGRSGVGRCLACGENLKEIDLRTLVALKADEKAE